MKRLILISAMATAATGCGKRSAVGTIAGGAAGTTIGYSMADGDSRNPTLIGLGIGAALGLIVGGILDLSSRDTWACPDNEPRCLD